MLTREQDELVSGAVEALEERLLKTMLREMRQREERQAWDGYMREALKYYVDTSARGISDDEWRAAADAADAALAERRKRFGTFNNSAAGAAKETT